MAINPSLFDWSTPTAASSATIAPQPIGPPGPPPGYVPPTKTPAPTPKPTVPPPTTQSAPSAPAAPSAPSPEEIARQQEQERLRQLMAEVENMYNSRMGYINEVENTVRGQQPGIEQNISNVAQQNLNDAETMRQRGEREISTTEQGSESRMQNAINAARQVLSEAGLGFGQRFGAASNMARALGEYAGTKFQQTAGQARNAYQDAITKLNEQRMQLSENFRSTTEQINNWRVQTITDAQNQFRNKLLEIQGMKTQAEEAKSQLRIQALQELQARIDNAKMLAYQYQLQAAANAKDYATQIQQKMSEFTTGLAGRTNQIGNSVNAQISGLDVSAPTVQTAPSIDQSVGMMAPRLTSRASEEDIYSSAIPSASVPSSNLVG